MSAELNATQLKKIKIQTRICIGIVAFILSCILLPRLLLNNYNWPLSVIKKCDTISHDSLVKYGRKLIEHTAFYLGPQGVISQQTNGMNCQNCHLEAGTKSYGNNYLAVAANYPKFRPRSGTIESVKKRINDCIERSLNGKKLDTNSLEMRAMEAYVLWVGRGVPAKSKPRNAGIAKLNYLNRAANPEMGKNEYTAFCARCHGSAGEGVKKGSEYLYPPLWGNHSFNQGAGLYRVSTLAGFLRYNMPNGASFENPGLTEEQSWDIAAYIESLPRPDMDISHDWPDISQKPVDHPFGPYADTFSENTHKYGPFNKMKIQKNIARNK